MITKEQQDFRGTRLGASDAAAAIGISPWDTPAQKAAQILGLIKRPYIPGAHYGNLIEPGLAECYMYDTKTRIVHHGETVCHKEHDWLLCHPDYITEDGKRLVEFKSVGFGPRQYWGKVGDPNGVPPYVRVQCVVQADLCGVEDVDVGAYFGGTDFRIFNLHISKKEKGEVMDKLVAFWAYVEAGELPPMTANDTALLKKLYPNPEENAKVRADDDTEKRAVLLSQLKSSVKTVEENKKMYENKIKAYMGDNEELVGSDGKTIATWKKNKSGTRVFKLS